jgi:hypothetical protein
VLNLGNRIVIIAVPLWIGAIAFGFAQWENYDATAGPSPASMSTFADAPPACGWELSMYAHPRCSCTQASLAQLAILAERAGPNLAIRVVFLLPTGAAEEWADGSIRSAAEKLPKVEIVLDRGGVEMARVGATTSGSILLRDAGGRIAFRGGLTRSRGQFGESAGQRAIGSLIAGGTTEIDRTPVFGCSLLDSDP